MYGKILFNGPKSFPSFRPNGNITMLSNCKLAMIKFNLVGFIKRNFGPYIASNNTLSSSSSIMVKFYDANLLAIHYEVARTNKMTRSNLQLLPQGIIFINLNSILHFFS
jgi:hypothetical protein